jgi:hypothetical protein
MKRLYLAGIIGLAIILSAPFAAQARETTKTDSIQVFQSEKFRLDEKSDVHQQLRPDLLQQLEKTTVPSEKLSREAIHQMISESSWQFRRFKCEQAYRTLKWIMDNGESLPKTGVFGGPECVQVPSRVSGELLDLISQCIEDTNCRCISAEAGCIEGTSVPEKLGATCYFDVDFGTCKSPFLQYQEGVIDIQHLSYGVDGVTKICVPSEGDYLQTRIEECSTR